MLLLTQDIALTISHEKVRANEVWLSHAPVSHPDRYRDYFGAEVRFGQSMNGIFFPERDLDLPIPSVDEQVYEISTAFIQKNFPLNRGVLTTRVRSTVESLLSHRDLSLRTVASLLGMRCRTLQRHLRAEGQSLGFIQDSVRREAALRYLEQSTLSLYQIARLLGYADTSILSRSCQRWFSLTATELRAGANQGRPPMRFASVSAT